MLGLIGIGLSLVTLIGMAYRGFPVIVIAPLASFIALVFAGAPLLGGYTQIFMPGAAGFIASFFPLFLTGAVFGKLMADTGYAQAFAYGIVKAIGPGRAVLATALTAAILTYGGVSLFVVAFTLYPIARELFIKADISKRLLPAAMAVGAFTFSMSALPGSPQIQNVIPARYFSTSLYSAPLYGFIGAAVMLGGGLAWVTYRARSLRAAGEGYDSDDSPPAETMSPNQTATKVTPSGTTFMLAVIPVLMVIGGNLVLSNWVLPNLDFAYLAQDEYGGTSLESVLAVWSVLISIIAAIGYILLTQSRQLRALSRSISDGARESLLPVFSTASEAGYGAVISSIAAFTIISQQVSGLSSNPLITSAVATTLLAGITGSASGGMTVALETMSGELKVAAAEQGVSLELLHRVTSMSSGGLDSLPHAGAIITMFMICRLTHRQAYKDVAVTTVVIPLIAVVVVIGLHSVIG
ncbi:GntP family permease [Brevibacterium aurantiacum]|uniref:GntP family permease n=1 Tax=Brevibacterium aurantiacum TaxID=273384 RepID=UPI001868F42A|nr:GntP family permease [Brevibacterium aurantiacum]